MPQNIEEVFTANGLSLFPLHWLISAACLPRQSQPASIGCDYYQLGDPSAKTRLYYFNCGVALKTKSSPPTRQLRAASVVETPNTDTQISKIDSFWQYNEPLESALVVIAPPPTR